jgi:MFS family permease
MNSTGRTTALAPKRMLRALHHRNYRLFFAGQGVSLVGTWMQRIAMGWLVYRLSHSAFMLGMVGFTGQLPIFLLSPVAGVLADRLDRHRVLLATQSLAMLQALVLAILVLTGHVQIWHIVVLAIFLGFVDAFDMPIRQAFLVDIVERQEDLGNAIALNSSIVNSARLLGPSVAGLLIAYMGEGMCFLLNAASYVAVLYSLLAMRLGRSNAAPTGTPLVKELKEGFSYAFGFPPIRSILILISMVSFFGMPLTVLMPVFARDILRGDSHTLGFLMGASGMGALFGSACLASRKTILGLEKWNAVASGVFGLGLILFSQSRSLWLSLFLSLATGLGMLIQNASGNTLLQSIVDEDKRGRVMSLYATAFRGVVPFGSLVGGILASRIGAPNTLMIGGILCSMAALLFARALPSFRSMTSPIYRTKGIA